MGYKMNSECKKSNITVNGKREYTRSYTFTLGKILTDENKKYLEWWWYDLILLFFLTFRLKAVLDWFRCQMGVGQESPTI